MKNYGFQSNGSQSIEIILRNMDRLVKTDPDVPVNSITTDGQCLTKAWNGQNAT